MLSNEEIEKSITEELDNKWDFKDGKLVKSFRFSSFMNAIYFVNEVAKDAIKQDAIPATQYPIGPNLFPFPPR